MILSCGEALIDMLPRQTAAGEPAFAPYSGGAVYNTAVALGRLGAPSGFFSGLSTDLFGQQLVRDLAAAQVDTALAVRSARNTTLAFVSLNNGKAEYAFFDEGTAGRMLDVADLPELPDAVAALHFGAISLIPEPCGSAYEALCLREAKTRVISFDPNIRPNFIPDKARHRARMERMAAAADIIKLSDEDLHWFAAGDFDTVAQRWLGQGAALVIMTQGDHGAEARYAGGRIAVPAVKVSMVDTVGAGDTFNAGLLAALWRKGLLSKQALRRITPDALTAALNYAAAAAAITVSRAGANPPWLKEMPPLG